MYLLFLILEKAMFEDSYLSEQRLYLQSRRKTKEMILSEGGEQSLTHSTNDLVRIDFALRRIDEGQYGLCTNCGCSINRKRLQAIPETPFCVACASEIETT